MECLTEIFLIYLLVIIQVHLSLLHQVLATDQGDPQNTATARVIVNIIDSNNQNPVLQPTTVRADVNEGRIRTSPLVSIAVSFVYVVECVQLIQVGTRANDI